MSVLSPQPTISAFRLLDRARTVAGTGYKRWLVPPAALAIHPSIGQAYAFSVDEGGNDLLLSDLIRTNEIHICENED